MASSSPYSVPTPHHLHAGYGNAVTRRWQSGDSILEKAQLMYPIFVTERTGTKQAINAMPEQFQWSVDRLDELVAPLISKGLASVLIFGVFTTAAAHLKGPRADNADAADSPVVRSVKHLRTKYPNLLIACDLCMCAYTTHGHCCVFHPDGTMNNADTVVRLGEMAVAFARAGADIIAPSDMADGRVGAIKAALRQANLGRVGVMSYSAKFASCFYGPFREAAGSAPAFGDRKCYQLPPGARGLALRAVDRDVAEGADFVMVKPAGPYLDIIAATRARVEVPVACYHVSGEYAMLWHASAAGAFDLKTAVLEALTGFRRAGATIIITYYTPQLLDWLS
jgi:porphobilinogen synthase